MMVTVKYIQNLKLLKLDAIIKIDNNAEKYLGWESLDKKFKETIEFVGEIVTKEQFKFKYPSDENYWSPQCPISLNHYPYYGCKLFKSKKHEIYYLVYTEFGGHIPEERCRLLQKELIIM